MFNSLTHAEAAFRAAINSGDKHQATDAFDYVLAECIRRGKARLVWHQEPPRSEQETQR